MTKNAVLAVLKKASGYVSGEAISRDLGVSRMAVSSAVKTLRADGYEIDSAPRRGYRLISSPDRLSRGELGAYLSADRLENVVCLDRTDSTNRRLHEMAVEGAPDGRVVIANEQTAGRGRRGRSFVSLKDKGIYFSVLLRPQCPASDLRTITAWTAVAIARAVESVTGLQPQIKWVNDLILDRRKICGILTELTLDAESGSISHVIVGIGVNVNQSEEDFPDDLKLKAGSLKMAGGHNVSRSALAAAMVTEMDRLRSDWPHNVHPYLEFYRKRCLNVDTEVTVITGSSRRTAHAVDINDDFSLLVRYPDGTGEALTSGEISVRGTDGYL